MPEEKKVLDHLQKLYFTLDRYFNKLFAACQTDEQRDQFRSSYVNARDNFWEARNRVFQENDPLVKSLVDELKAAQKLIEEFLKSSQDIVETLKIIAAAVHLGASIICLGSA